MMSTDKKCSHVYFTNSVEQHREELAKEDACATIPCAFDTFEGGGLLLL